MAEPWRLKHPHQGHIVAAGSDDEPFTVANCWSGPFAPERPIAWANARRIRACVNALAGIPIDFLERLPAGALADAVEQILQMRSQS
jgi:hypothetical protein